MRMPRFLPFLFALLLPVSSRLDAQPESRDRQPSVAGQFYPAQEAQLTAMLKVLFRDAAARKAGADPAALISPHAGYVYSGVVAASAINQIDPARRYDLIILIGASHSIPFEGVAVPAAARFLTPLGPVPVNTEVVERLVRSSSLIVRRDDVHAAEHSLEVQLPLLQYHLQKEFRIVPMSIGVSSPSTCATIAEVLRPYFRPGNLFIISSDFSHYPSDGDARVVDRETAQAVLANSPARVMAVTRSPGDAEIPNLVTRMCGWPAVLTLAYLTEKVPGISYELIQYKTSADAMEGQKTRVVGYHAIAVRRASPAPGQGLLLRDADKRRLLTIARESINHFMGTGTAPVVDPNSLSPVLRTECGAFVSLYRRESLRGCIGRFEADTPLYKVVQQMAIAAATEDHRFVPVEADEVAALSIEISVLTPLRRIASIDEIELGRHGIYIRKGVRSGTFLPQVAQQTGWTRDEFLGHCARDKAGLGWDGWREAEIYVYEAIIFDEHDLVTRRDR